MENKKKQVQAQELLQKYLRGECTGEEKNRVLNWYQALEKASTLEDTNSAELKQLSRQVRKSTLKTVKSHHKRASIKKFIQPSNPLLRIAALFLILIGGILFIFHSRKMPFVQHLQVFSDTSSPESDILLSIDSLPSLTLQDGSINYLGGDHFDQNKMDMIALVRDADGMIVYKVQPHLPGDFNEDLITETIVFSNPKGHKSKLILADGTQVWLNSGSSLTYPVSFKKQSREVRLLGEAYFEVAHSHDRPFYVETDKAKIKVLGTKFNVNAYSDESDVVTTLLQGSVQLITTKSKVVLQPGQQYFTGEAGTNKLNIGADVIDALSWKEGYFSFNNVTIADVLKAVQRWYNIQDVVFIGSSNEKITGTFQQSNSLKELLDRLELVCELKFEIREGRVMVR